MKKTITVAIPVFNGEQYILEALQSIIEQSIKVDKILVCDNNSTDKTREIVEQFKKQNKNWNIILHVNDHNLGNIRNYNKCMELCDLDYLLILSSDDKLKTDTIKKQFDFLERHPDVALVAGQVDYIDENGKYLIREHLRKNRILKPGEIFELISETRLWIQHSAVLLRTKYIKTIGYWDHKNIGGDERFWAQVLQKYPIALIGEAWVDQRVHTNQLGTREHLRFKDKITHFETNLKVADWEKDPAKARKAKRILKNWIASQSIAVSKSVWTHFGKKGLAIRYWFYGLKKNPTYYYNRYIHSKIKSTVKDILSR